VRGRGRGDGWGLSLLYIPFISHKPSTVHMRHSIAQRSGHSLSLLLSFTVCLFPEPMLYDAVVPFLFALYMSCCVLAEMLSKHASKDQSQDKQHCVRVCVAAGGSVPHAGCSRSLCCQQQG